MNQPITVEPQFFLSDIRGADSSREGGFAWGRGPRSESCCNQSQRPGTGSGSGPRGQTQRLDRRLGPACPMRLSQMTDWVLGVPRGRRRGRAHSRPSPCPSPSPVFFVKISDSRSHAKNAHGSQVSASFSSSCPSSSFCPSFSSSCPCRACLWPVALERRPVSSPLASSERQDGEQFDGKPRR